MWRARAVVFVYYAQSIATQEQLTHQDSFQLWGNVCLLYFLRTSEQLVDVNYKLSLSAIIICVERWTDQTVRRHSSSFINNFLSCSNYYVFLYKAMSPIYRHFTLVITICVMKVGVPYCTTFPSSLQHRLRRRRRPHYHYHDHHVTALLIFSFVFHVNWKLTLWVHTYPSHILSSRFFYLPRTRLLLLLLWLNVDNILYTLVGRKWAF